jgi:hypothetical protein
MSFDFFEDHKLHSNLFSDTHNHAYLHIPVNASCWGKTIFSSAGFRPDNQFSIPPDCTVVVFLRDPIERWLSGLSTWLTYRLPQHTDMTKVRNNTTLLDVLFDTIKQDDHTERQMFFLQNLNTDQIKFFLIGSEFQSSVNKYFLLNFNQDISKYPKENATTFESGKLKPREYFQTVLESNTKYLNRVKEFFECDYNFIKKIQFENQQPIKLKYYDY